MNFSGARELLNACRVEGPVETLKWDDPEQQRLARKRLDDYASYIGDTTAGPVLIKGALVRWPALETWTLKWLASTHGGQR
jgi:hypothetical protein